MGEVERKFVLVVTTDGLGSPFWGRLARYTVEAGGARLTNEELVRRVVLIADELNRELATPKEALAILDRDGSSTV